MKWYLVRNQSHDPASTLDVLEEAAKGEFRIRGYGKTSTTEEMRAAYESHTIIPPHSEVLLKILSTDDKGRGVICDRGLKIGKHGPFLLKETDSPRHIWTELPEAKDLEDDDYYQD